MNWLVLKNRVSSVPMEYRLILLLVVCVYIPLATVMAFSMREKLHAFGTMVGEQVGFSMDAAQTTESMEAVELTYSRGLGT